MSASTAAIAATTINANLQFAQKNKCNNAINAYSPNTATITEMQEYAHCVQLIHPEKCSQLTAWFIFIICVVAIINGISLCYREYQVYNRDFSDCVLAGFVGFFLTIEVALIIFVIGYSLSLPFIN